LLAKFLEFAIRILHLAVRIPLGDRDGFDELLEFGSGHAGCSHPPVVLSRWQRDWRIDREVMMSHGCPFSPLLKMFSTEKPEIR
jgi:hypothetical protein